MSTGRKNLFVKKKKKLKFSMFTVELDLVCPEIDVDDFSSVSSKS